MLKIHNSVKSVPVELIDGSMSMSQFICYLEGYQLHVISNNGDLIIRPMSCSHPIDNAINEIHYRLFRVGRKKDDNDAWIDEFISDLDSVVFSTQKVLEAARGIKEAARVEQREIDPSEREHLEFIRHERFPNSALSLKGANL